MVEIKITIKVPEEEYKERFPEGTLKLDNYYRNAVKLAYWYEDYPIQKVEVKHKK